MTKTPSLELYWEHRGIWNLFFPIFGIPHSMLGTWYHRIIEVQGSWQVTGPHPLIRKTKRWSKTQKKKENCLELLSSLEKKLGPEGGACRHLATHFETEQDPAGFLGREAFLCSLLLALSFVPKGRFKYLLIREGTRCRDKGEAAKKQHCSWDRSLVPTQGMYLTVSLNSLQN